MIFWPTVLLLVLPILILGLLSIIARDRGNDIPFYMRGIHAKTAEAQDDSEASQTARRNW